MKYSFLPGLLALFVLPWSYCLADQSAAQADFQEGVAAFQNGEIEKARQRLEQARQAGLSSSSLLYNLGVVYFRLGRFDDAEAAFTELLATSHAPLARYNLGLVLKEKGDPQGARRWFVRAADSSAPAQIQNLAQQQLATETQADVSAPDSSRTVGFISIAAGYDDNIASVPSSATTNEAGTFSEVVASGRAYVYENQGGALRLDAVAYAREYSGSGDFDNAYFSAGAAWQQPTEAGRLMTGISVAGSWFGADLLERQARLDVSYERPGCFWPQVLTMYCDIEGYASAVQGGSGFEAYDGQAFGGAFNAVKTTGPWALDASYRLAVDRRNDVDAGSEFFSLSPTRHQVSISAERQITGAFSLGAEQTLGFSRYADAHRLVQSGQVQNTTREDRNVRAGLFAWYQLDARWRLGIELSRENNHSTIERFAYRRTEFLVSIDGVF